MSGADGWSVLFNKKTLDIYHNPKGGGMTLYNKEGLYNFDEDNVAHTFKKAYKYKGETVQPNLKISLVPFTRLNTLDDMKAAPERNVVRKHYKKRKG